MPGDPNECRLHAARCSDLAETATMPEARQHFINLAQSWNRLVSELEAAQRFLDAMGALELEPEKVIRPRPSAPSRGVHTATFGASSKPKRNGPRMGA
jgi:hypothetical protein